jgi:hypothetical protein
MPTAGYSKTPLWKKLGYKEGVQARLLGAPENYSELLLGCPEGIVFENKQERAKDLIHYFSKDAKELFERLLALKMELKQNGMIWVSWPKKASKVQTDITEDIIRDFALKIGLVDVKVCAVDLVWSGLKLVIHVKDRK